MIEQDSLLQEAAAVLRSGKLVAFPTETVYGLGADAANAEALALLYKVKGRPTRHPCIVHLSSLSDLSQWCETVPESALKLGSLFWPGPLTLVLRKAPHVLPELTGGQDTVAVRVPAHKTALALISAFGSGIAAPSANRFGHLSPTSAEHVRAEFGDDVEIVLDGGQCQVGIESTIVDLSTAQPRILRPGMITSEKIFAALSELGLTEVQGKQVDAPRVPGALASHYAPSTPLLLVDSAKLKTVCTKLKQEGEKIALLSISQATLPVESQLSISNNPEIFAHTIYGYLRQLDCSGASVIVVEKPPDSSPWRGINDRLQRAAGQSDTNSEDQDGC